MSGEIVPPEDLPDAPSSDVVPPEDMPDAVPDETAGRVAELATRAIGRGVAAVPGAVTSLTMPGIAQTAISAGTKVAHAVRQKLGWDPEDAPTAASPSQAAPEPKLSDFIHPDKWPDAVDYLADKAGLAKPATPTERVASKAVEALPSGVMAPETPILGALSAGAGSAASQGAKEAGVGPIGQTMAGLAAGSIPSVVNDLGPTAIRRVLGGDSAATAQNNISTAAKSGTKLTAGQATGSPVLQKAEAAMGAMWGGGPIQKAAEQRAASLDNHVSGIIDNLTTPGATLSPTSAGTGINKGIDATKQSMRDAEGAAYDKVDALVPEDHPVDVSHSIQIAKGLAAPTSQEALNTAIAPSGIAKFASALTESAADGHLNYSDLSQLRSAVGAKIDRGFAPANPAENGAYQQLYKALTLDKNAGAAAISPEASQAVGQANSLYKANSMRRDTLNKILKNAGGTPEGLYQAATGKMKNGATTINNVMGAIDPDEQNLVRATVLDRMGRAVPSAQDETGSVFSPESFLTKWNGMSREAKDALFGSSGPSSQLRSNLDSFTSTLSTLRKANALKNPSGTGPLIAHAIGVGNIISDVALGIFTGHPIALAGMALPVANNILARGLTNPKTAAWLAKSVKLPAAAVPNAVNQLRQMNDPDAQNLANYFDQTSQHRTPRAAGGKVSDTDALVSKLITRWKNAKRATNESTKPLLRMEDSAVAKALEIAQEHI